MIYALGWSITILSWLLGMQQVMWINYKDAEPASVGILNRLGRLVLIGLAGIGMLIGLFVLGYGAGAL